MGVTTKAGGAAAAFAAAALSSGAVAQDSRASGQTVSQLDEVVVTATRRDERLIDVPASVSVQRVDDLRRSGFTYGTDEFRGVPGVSFRRGEGDGDEFVFASVRGSTGVEGYLALIDGISFVNVDEEPQLNQMPYDALERIEVVKGPVSALYGRGSLYGAVNYITRSPRRADSSLTLSAGSDDYRRGAATLAGPSLDGRAGALFSVSYEDYAGWRANSGRQALNLFTKADFDLDERTTLTAWANYADKRSFLPSVLPLTADGEVLTVAGGPEAFVGFGAPYNDFQGLIGALRLEHRPSDDLTFTLTGQARRFEQDVRLNFYDPFGFNPARNVMALNGFASQSEQDVLFAEGTVAWRLGRHNIIAGASAERAESNSLDLWSGQNGFTPECGFSFYLIEVDYSTGRAINADDPCFVIDDPFTRDELDNTFVGVFVQDEIALTDRLSLTLGVRYDAFDRTVRVASPAASPFGATDGDADAISPKASLSWRYGGGQVYFTYGRGFNSNFGTSFEWDPAQYARPENRPTTLDSYEIGWKGRVLDDRLRFELAAYATSQTDRRVVIPNPAAETDVTAPANLVTFGQRYEVRGLEASVDYRPSDRTRLVAQYSRVEPEWDDYVVQTFSGPIDLSGTTPVGVSEDIVYLSAEHAVTPWISARASFEYYGDYQVTQTNSVQGGGYELVTLNARLILEALRGATLDLTVTNALDEDYAFLFGGRTAPTYATPGPPRQFRATLRRAF